MNFPVIICDTDGRPVYKSRSVNSDGFLSLCAVAKGKVKKSGITVYDGKTYYFKETSLCGRKYFIISPYNTFALFKGRKGNALEELFDINTAKQDRVNISLEQLSELFGTAYAAELYKGGVKVVVHKLAKNVAVDLSPKLFMLSLALMAKLSSYGGAVRFTFANECGRVTVYADSEIGNRKRRKEDEVLEFMLYEVASKAGFAVEKTGHDGKIGYALSLSPLDISLLGFKAPDKEYIEEICRCYAAIFL